MPLLNCCSALIQVFLRSIPRIDETLLAKRANVDQEIVQTIPEQTGGHGCDQLPSAKTLAHGNLLLKNGWMRNPSYISREHYQTRKIRYSERANTILMYSMARDKCRSQALLAYFGEADSPACGECDVCRNKSENTILTQEDFNLIRDELLAVIAREPLSLESLFNSVPVNKDKVIQVLQWLLDNDTVKFNEEQLLILSH